MILSSLHHNLKRYKTVTNKTTERNKIFTQQWE